MGYFIALRRGVLKFMAAGAAVAKMPVAGDFDLGRDDIFLIMRANFKGVLITQRMPAVGASIQFLVNGCIDMVGLFPTAARLSLFLAQFLHALPGSAGRLELRLGLFGRS